MPIYEYKCASCGFQKEYLQKVTDPVHTTCPDCGKESFTKMLSAAGFMLKGSGWYATDFKNGGAKKSDGGKSDGAKSDRGKSGTDSEVKAKPAAHACGTGCGCG